LVSLHFFFVENLTDRYQNHILIFFSSIKSNKIILKMTAWRAAGLNYINYSTIAAQLLRKALKPELRVAAAKRGKKNYF
jgi:F-type H+-transporting ATPase subunit epsilon